MSLCLALSARASETGFPYRNSFPSHFFSFFFNIHVSFMYTKKSVRRSSSSPLDANYHLLCDARISLYKEKQIFLLQYRVNNICSRIRRMTGTYQIVIKFPAFGNLDYSGADFREGALQPKIGRHHCGIILQLGSILSEGTRMLPFVI